MEPVAGLSMARDDRPFLRAVHFVGARARRRAPHLMKSFLVLYHLTGGFWCPPPMPPP